MSSFLERLGATNRPRLTATHVDTDWGPLNVFETPGQGHGNLVLVHGLSADASIFSSLLPRLRHRFARIILPDLLGHGDSHKPLEGLTGDVANRSLGQALDQILDAPAMLFGNSLGGYGAIRYASTRPEMVSALAVSSPGGGFLPAADFDALMARFKVDSHRDALSLVNDGKSLPLGPLAHLVALRVRRRMNQVSVRAFIETLGSHDTLSESELQGLQMPVLLLWGSHEQLFPRACFEWFREHLPEHAAVEEPENFGHAPMSERPRALADRLLAFAEAHLG